MAGITVLNELLKSMTPEIKSGEYLFCTVDGNYSDYAHVSPLAFFLESEGLTLIVLVEAADPEGGLNRMSGFQQYSVQYRQAALKRMPP